MKYTLRYRVRKTLFESLDHSTIRMLFDQQGFMGLTYNDIETKVYTPELATILTTENLPVIEQGTKIEKSIGTNEFVNTYAAEFKKGSLFFKENFAIRPDTLYGNNADTFVRDIHMNYCHTQHKPHFEGWNSVKKTYPRLISHSTIGDYGYFSGVLSEADKMIKTYPVIFSTYDKCSIINDSPIKSYSYSEYAMALNLKNISINKKGIGVTDGVNYIEKFNLKPGQTLYNKLNEIINQKIVNANTMTEVGRQIIKQYNL